MNRRYYSCELYTLNVRKLKITEATVLNSTIKALKKLSFENKIKYQSQYQHWIKLVQVSSDPNVYLIYKKFYVSLASVQK